MLGSLRALQSNPVINTTQAITATSTITIAASVSSQIRPVSTATDIVLTSSPQLATGTNGQFVTIQNAGTGDITFADGNGLSLQGTLVLGSTQFATFVNLGGFWQLESTNGSPVWTAITFANSFANQAGFQPCEYTRFLGVVSLRGNASRSIAYSAPVSISTLPAGFRPSNLMRFNVDAIGAPGTDNVLEVSAAGVLNYISSGTPATQQASLNAIRYQA